MRKQLALLCASVQTIGMSPLLLLLLPDAAPTPQDTSLQLYDKDFSSSSSAISKADAPFFMLKLDRTGSSWFKTHLDNMKIYSEVRGEVNNEPMDWAKNRFGSIGSGAGQKAYCKMASESLVNLLKGKGGKYGAGTLNPFKAGDLKVNHGKLEWHCMGDIKEAVKLAVKAGDMPPPNSPRVSCVREDSDE